VSYIEAFLVLGLSAGVVIGGEFYEMGGFCLPFYIFTILIIILIIAIYCFVPNK